MAASPALGTPDFERTCLSRREREVVRAIGEAMFAEDGEVDRVRLDAVVEEVERYVGAASAALRFGLRVLLFVVRISPLLLFVSASPLERLPVEARVATLTRLERHRMTPLSLAFVAWRAIVILVFYDDATELARVGYADARTRHKRRLATVPRAPSAPRIATVPPVAESGVRLRDGGLADAADDDDDDDEDDDAARKGAA